MDKQNIQLCADLLFDSERSRKSIKPLSDMYPDITVEDAYAIQMDNVNRVLSMGHVISGKKIGLTSPGIQQQMGVNEPDYGHLFAAMDCPDGVLQTDKLMQPKIEAELAFILKEDLTGGNVTVEDVKRATDYVVAAFEIVDSRVSDWKIKLMDTVADNASSGRYVLGETRLNPNEVDLREIGMQLFKNGEQIDKGTGAAVLGDPCEAVAWLSNKMHQYGVVLKKGEVILSGAFSAAPVAAKGDEFEAVFTQFGSVKAKFV